MQTKPRRRGVYELSQSTLRHVLEQTTFAGLPESTIKNVERCIGVLNDAQLDMLAIMTSKPNKPNWTRSDIAAARSDDDDQDKKPRLIPYEVRQLVKLVEMGLVSEYARGGEYVYSVPPGVKAVHAELRARARQAHQLRRQESRFARPSSEPY